MHENKKTINEIAAISGFSKATVSRVLSSSKLVKNETRDKILKVIKRLNYEPNIVARSLKTRKTSTIGLILGDIENPFYSRVAKGAIDAAELNGYNVILCNSGYDTLREEKIIQTLLARQIDGLLITTVKLKQKTIDELKNKNIPYVLIDCRLDIEGISYVVNDDHFGGTVAAEYLMGLGHKKIAFFGNRNLLSFKNRYEGFIRTLDCDKTISKVDYLINDINDASEINCCISRLVDGSEGVSAIFAVNDFLALKIIDALTSLQIKVPQDISIIGYDNIVISSMLKVPLTTINQPKYRTGKLAFQQLIEMLNDRDAPVKKIVLNPELVVRHSCIRL